MVIRSLVLLAALLTVTFSPQGPQAQGKPEFSNYEYSVTDDGTFGLYKPKGWKVGTQRYPNARMVFVIDQKDLSYVSLLFQESIDPGFDSVKFASATLKNVIQQIPDLQVLEARSSQDRMHTVVKISEDRFPECSHRGKILFQYQASHCAGHRIMKRPPSISGKEFPPS